jgi:hypothetical protein
MQARARFAGWRWSGRGLCWKFESKLASKGFWVWFGAVWRRKIIVDRIQQRCLVGLLLPHGPDKGSVISGNPRFRLWSLDEAKGGLASGIWEAHAG